MTGCDRLHFNPLLQDASGLKSTIALLLAITYQTIFEKSAIRLMSARDGGQRRQTVGADRFVLRHDHDTFEIRVDRILQPASFDDRRRRFAGSTSAAIPRSGRLAMRSYSVAFGLVREQLGSTSLDAAFAARLHTRLNASTTVLNASRRSPAAAAATAAARVHREQQIVDSRRPSPRRRRRNERLAPTSTFFTRSAKNSYRSLRISPLRVSCLALGMTSSARSNSSPSVQPQPVSEHRSARCRPPGGEARTDPASRSE